MPNELLFLLQSIFLLGSTLGAFCISERLLQILICVQVICANLFIVKTMPLCGLHACGGGMYIVGSMFGLLLLQRFASKGLAEETLKLSVLFSLFFVCMALFQLWYNPAVSDASHYHFYVLLSRVPRATISSLFAHTVSHACSLYISRFVGGPLSLLCGQGIDSALFFTGTFIGLMPVVQIGELILVSLLLKGVMVALSSAILFALERRKKQEREHRV